MARGVVGSEWWWQGGAKIELVRLRSNISNMGCSVSSPDETPTRELKIRCAAEYF